MIGLTWTRGQMKINVATGALLRKIQGVRYGKKTIARPY